MRLACISKVILLVMIGLGILAVVYYTGIEKSKRASFNLIPTPVLPTTPSTSNLLVTPSPTPTITPQIDTPDWKTYRNEEYGYEIKYPNNTTVKKAEGEVNLGLPFTQGTNLSHKYLVINIKTINSNEKCFDEQAYRSAGVPYEIVKLNNIEFKKTTETQGGMESFDNITSYFSENGSNCYTLNFHLEGWKYKLPSFDKARESEVFDQMLSTFKFIEK